MNFIVKSSHYSFSKFIFMNIKQIMWMSMLLFFMQNFKCNNLIKTLTLYLMNSKIKKKTIDVLFIFNVCVFYNTTQRLIKHLIVLKKNEICFNISNEKQAKFYNNFDFVNHKFVEKLKNRKIQRDIIIVFQFQIIMISNENLRQNMWRSNHKIRMQNIVVINENTKKLFRQINLFRNIWFSSLFIYYCSKSSTFRSWKFENNIFQKFFEKKTRRM